MSWYQWWQIFLIESDLPNVPWLAHAIFFGSHALIYALGKEWDAYKIRKYDRKVAEWYAKRGLPHECSLHNNVSDS